MTRDGFAKGLVIGALPGRRTRGDNNSPDTNRDGKSCFFQRTELNWPQWTSGSDPLVTYRQLATFS